MSVFVGAYLAVGMAIACVVRLGAVDRSWFQTFWAPFIALVGWFPLALALLAQKPVE